MKPQQYLRKTIGILLLTLGLTGCNIGENLTLFLTPNYSGAICLDLGVFKGSLKVRITDGDREYHFRTGDRKHLLHHAVELMSDRSQDGLNINIRGDIDSGQLEPNLYYGLCREYAQPNWHIYDAGDFVKNRMRFIRIIAGIMSGLSLILLCTQIKHLLNILSAEDYTIKGLLQDLQQNRKNIYVKVSGNVRAEKPLYSPWKNMSCVYYTKEVTQTYKPRGKKTRETKTLEYKSQRIPFQLQDDSVSIEILPNSAIIGACSVSQETQSASLGDIKTKESALLLDTRVLVVGMAKYERDRPLIMKPDLTVKQQAFQIYQEDAIALEKNIRNAIRFAFILLVLASTFLLPLFVPDMVDPAMIVYELTKDL